MENGESKEIQAVEKMDERSLKDFLEKVPPGKWALIPDFSYEKNFRTYIAAPELQLHCTSEKCQGVRGFLSIRGENFINDSEKNDVYLIYRCRNCGKSFKTFSLSVEFDSNSQKWRVFKYGELPSFGPPIPARAITLIGGERELFLQGRQCENQGMGIGAFVYYRRVIESQKNRIFDELIRVINKISPQDEVLADLEAAKKETRFTNAVDTIKHALPQSLYINGKNPLNLLHSALSEGVHDHNDDECLELASSVRNVLFEFAERLGQALKEEADLIAAVNRLANKKKIT